MYTQSQTIIIEKCRITKEIVYETQDKEAIFVKNEKRNWRKLTLGRRRGRE